MSKIIKKITLYNQHFAFITQFHLNKLAEIKNVTNITEYIQEKVMKQFHLTLTEGNDIEELSKRIDEENYDSNTEWLVTKISEDINGVLVGNTIDEMLCLDEIQSIEDIAMAKEAGFDKAYYTASQLRKNYPDLDTSKIFFDNHPNYCHAVYYDKDKYAMIEMVEGYPIGCADFLFKNFMFMIQPSFSGEISEYYLRGIDEIYESFCKGQYELFASQNMQFHRNEILEKIIESTDDKNLKLRLKECQDFED